VNIRFVSSDGIEDREEHELDELLARTDGFVWLDIVTWSDAAEAALTSTAINMHPMAVASCKQRNHVPTIHAYPSQVFVVLHSPKSGGRGHVHLLELDLVIGTRYLVTVHGPLNPELDVSCSTEECDEVARRIAFGRFHPSTPAELSYAVVSGMARRQRALIGEIAELVPDLEQRVMQGDFRQPEALLEEMFLFRHELITVRTMAAQSYEIYARMTALDRMVPASDIPYARDLADQFERVRSIADGECQFLFNVIDLYQTRVTTKMTVAMERLAVIAAITLPITAIASVYGMNVIVNQHTHVDQLVIVLVAMVCISGLLLRWARRQGWW
jgi:magnesium transporter